MITVHFKFLGSSWNCLIFLNNIVLLSIFLKHCRWLNLRNSVNQISTWDVVYCTHQHHVNCMVAHACYPSSQAVESERECHGCTVLTLSLNCRPLGVPEESQSCGTLQDTSRTIRGDDWGGGGSSVSLGPHFRVSVSLYFIRKNSRSTLCTSVTVNTSQWGWNLWGKDGQAEGKHSIFSKYILFEQVPQECSIIIDGRRSVLCDGTDVRCHANSEEGALMNGGPTWELEDISQWAQTPLDLYDWSGFLNGRQIREAIPNWAGSLSKEDSSSHRKTAVRLQENEVYWP